MRSKTSISLVKVQKKENHQKQTSPPVLLNLTTRSLLIHTLTGLDDRTANVLMTSWTFLYLQLNILIMISTAIDN
ncbi:MULTISPECIES: hypothetical protein [Nostoc]|uniref:Uncharacterized protein n=2 Tax=Nostoc TaxID=1177 RepID=A0ABR8I4I0_9NOSO|nr:MULTISPECIES: hypothetical protein [Nostoc]MBD2561352.1 hypothetical protein [Nostoc linckia FACHB-391]MBD2646492.1 hypothetical protein [Nostoc foliaceum FACHB-393]